MTLVVNGKTYDVVQNGTDYVLPKSAAIPKAEDFPGVFVAEVDGEQMENMRLAGIQLLDDGWHISIYQMSYKELLDYRTESVLNALLGGAA